MSLAKLLLAEYTVCYNH